MVASLQEPVAAAPLPERLPVPELLSQGRDVAPARSPATPHRCGRQSPVRPWSAGSDDSVLREIHSMRGMIEEQLAGLAWNEAQRRDPMRGQLLRTLLGAGFSARLAKELLADLPTGQNHASGLEPHQAGDGPADAHAGG